MRKLKLGVVKTLAQEHKTKINSQARIWSWLELTLKPRLLFTASLRWVEFSEETPRHKGPVTHGQSIRAKGTSFPFFLSGFHEKGSS